MDFHRRMQASMLIVIVVCMMCVSTVLAREEKLAEVQEDSNGDLYVTWEMDPEMDM